MTSRVCLCLALLASACGKFVIEPVRYRAQLVGPDPFWAMGPSSDVYTPAEQVPAAQLFCSLSSPLVAFTLEVQGCAQWSVDAPELRSVFSLSELSRVLFVDAFVTQTRSAITVTCHDLPDRPLVLDVPYEVQANRSQIYETVGFSAPIERLEALTDGKLVVSDGRTVALARLGPSPWLSLNEDQVLAPSQQVAVAGHAEVQTFGETLLVKDRCDSFGCASNDELIHAFTASGVVSARMPGSTDLIGTLGARLVLYQSVGLGPSTGQLLVTDPDFGNPHPIALSVAAFPSTGGLASGVTRGDHLVYIGIAGTRLWRIEIDPAEAVTETDLGSLSGAATERALLSPDAATVVLADAGAASCAISARDAMSGAARWTRALCPEGATAPIFVTSGADTLVVIATASELVALDLLTGETRWSWRRSRMGRPVALVGLRARGDATLVTTASPSAAVHVISFDGSSLNDYRLMAGLHAIGGTVAVDDRLVTAVDGALITETIPREVASYSVCGRVRCGGDEVDLTLDPKHCGGCDVACGKGAVCHQARCVDQPALD